MQAAPILGSSIWLLFLVVRWFFFPVPFWPPFFSCFARRRKFELGVLAWGTRGGLGQARMHGTKCLCCCVYQVSRMVPIMIRQTGWFGYFAFPSGSSRARRSRAYVFHGPPQVLAFSVEG